MKTNKLFRQIRNTALAARMVLIARKGALIIGFLFLEAHVTAQSNYQYDGNGRIIADFTAGIVKIEWNSINKIVRVTRADTCHSPDLEFSYDPSGNRVMKLIKPRNGRGLLPELYWIYTYYVSDETGIPISLYTRTYKSDKITPNEYDERYETVEQPIFYNGIRLGYKKLTGNNPLTTRHFRAMIAGDGGFDRSETITIITSVDNDTLVTVRASKTYELHNHLNNVTAVLSDRKVRIDNGFNSELISANDYYPFGMGLPNRHFGERFYHYGFNGKENENDLEGDGNVLNFDARFYDSRVGRWLSVDSFSEKYPSVTPYGFVANNPIIFIDPDGNDVSVSPAFSNSTYGRVFRKLSNSNSVFSSLISKYTRSSRYNLRFEYGENFFANNPNHADAKTISNKNGSKQYYSESGVQPLSVNGTVYEPSDIALANNILHESLHSYLSSIKVREEVNVNEHHDVFSGYLNMVVEGLMEYNEKEKLGYSEFEIIEVSIAGIQKSKLFRAYIEQIASANQTTYEKELAEFNLRMIPLLFQKRKPSAASFPIVPENKTSNTPPVGSKKTPTASFPLDTESPSKASFPLEDN